MKLFRHKKDHFSFLESFGAIQKEIIFNTDPNRYDELFIKLIQWLRSSKRENDLGVTKMGLLIEGIRKNASFQESCHKLFQYLIQNKDFTSLFTDTGILLSGSFLGEISRALRQKILPPLPDKKSMKYLLSRAFNSRSDYRFVNNIPKNLWVELFKLIGKNSKIQDSPVINQLFNGLSILSYRVMSLAVSDDLSKRWKAQAERYNAFLEQNRLCAWLIQMYQDGRFDPATLMSTIQELNQKLAECQSLVNDIKSNSVLYGTSLNQSYIITKITQQIVRMKALLKMVEPKPNIDTVVHTSVLMFTKIVEQINKSDQVKNVIGQSSGLLAYQVTEHKRETGEHYITTTRKEYYSLLWSSIKGGFIMSIAAAIKLLLGYIYFPTFWTYFFFSINYTIAFVLLYYTHSTLTTKQPAMTAAALAASMDTKVSDPSNAKVSIVLARVWRSQFASFIGNLFIVFPFCILLGMGYLFFFDEHMLRPALYAQNTLLDHHPILSLCLFYGGITGVCLFLSGIISGYVDNKVIFSNIPARILEHPLLKASFSQKTVKRISNFFKNDLGSTAGNIFLGFSLGFSPMIGSIFGIPFDTRHVTISTAFYGFSAVGLDFKLTTLQWIWTSIGILGIGFFNFITSFGLAFFIAIKSRDIPIKALSGYFSLIYKHLRSFPLDFIFPPRKPREPEELI